ncbi:MAG: FkbM family methyltransferase [Pirellulales bacterium]|nr:FkbM family methyltransferase [Pirellulales bacterium]
MSKRIRCLPILAGPLRGTYWAPASGGKIARIFMGTYEPDQTKLLQKSIGPSSVLLDVGANHGYYSLLASRLTGDACRTLAFEPHPLCADFLRRHIEANHLDGVTVVQAAVGKSSGFALFELGSGTGTGRVSDQGSHRIQVVTIDEVVAEHGLAPTHLKIDVEGGELDVLQGALSTLRAHRPEIYLSTHGADIHADCCQLLTKTGYYLAPIRGNQLESTPEIHCLPARARRRQAA